MFLFFFFFKQKTAYEMRISDWSSDVCSSDLRARKRVVARPAKREIFLLRAAPFGHQHVGDRCAGADDVVGREAIDRSEERRVGKECVSTCRSRWSPYH